MADLESTPSKNIPTIDLKLKITEIFNKIRPENRSGFIKKMNDYDIKSEMSFLDLSKDLSLHSSKLTRKNTGGAPRSESSSPLSTGSTVFSFEEEDLQKLEEAKKFLEQQVQDAEKGQFVENYALPESLTVYRDDEIVSELLDHFKESEPSNIFSNEDKLKLWIDDMMKLVKDTSSIRDSSIISAKDYNEDYKPIVENFEDGLGTGVSWCVPISEEKKKVYNAGDDTDFYFSVVPEDELKVENEIILADPKNKNPESKYIGYDHQQKKIYQLGKPTDNTEAENKIGLELDHEVYYIKDVNEEGDTFSLGKRVLDKGVTRLENISEKSKLLSKKKKLQTSKKQVIGIEEISIIPPEEISVSGFVVSKPGGKKNKPNDRDTYILNKLHVSSEYNDSLKKIVPFRYSGEQYVVFEDSIVSKDPLGLLLESEILLIDPKSIPVSSVKQNEKVILRFTYPYIHELEDIQKPQFLPDKKRPDVSDPFSQHIPNQIDILFRVENKEIVDNEYVLHVTPITSNKSLTTKYWENKSVVIQKPRIIQRFLCDCNELRENDKVFMVLTAHYKNIIFDKEKIVSIRNKNDYVLGMKDGKLVSCLNDELYLLEGKVISTLEDSIQVRIVDQRTRMKESLIDREFIVERSVFKNIYISKSEKSIELIQKTITSMENYENSVQFEDDDYKKLVTYYGETLSKLEKETGILQKEEENIQSEIGEMWGKVFAVYKNPNLKDAKYPNETVYLVQMLQNSLRSKIGEFILLSERKVKQIVPKRIFEKDFLGVDGSLTSWFKGLFISSNIQEIIPTLEQFLHRMSQSLLKKESIHYSFIEDIANLALKYKKYELHTSIKEQLHYWIEWNLIKHVESRSLGLVRMKTNFSELYYLYSIENELESEKIRLIKQIPSERLTEYSKWTVDLKDKKLSKLANKELGQFLEKRFKENADLWKSIKVGDLTKFQLEKLVGKEVRSEKKWKQVVSRQKEKKIRELRVLEAIYTIDDPVLRNKLLLDFIENNCYLGEDAETGGQWYFSKIDLTRTRLVCPHIYSELTDRKSLEQFYSKQQKDGTVICKNCGQILDTLVFSYFEGYGEGVSSRGRVDTIGGKEVVGTMEESEVVLSRDFVFSEEEQPILYLLEQICNILLKQLQPGIFQFLQTEEGSFIKEHMIHDIQLYLLEFNILDYEMWYRTNKDRLKTTNTDIINTKFRSHVDLRKTCIVISRICILLEKQVKSTLTANKDFTIDFYTKKYNNPYITNNKITDDYDKFVASGKFPLITEMYARSESTYIPESSKLLYEQKFAEYSLTNVDESLDLFDSIQWLKYYIRSIHKVEPFVAENSNYVCITDLDKDLAYGTEYNNVELIRNLEEHIRKYSFKESSRTGVKSRRQIQTEIEYILPEISGEKEKLMEAKLISKNLYILPKNKLESDRIIDNVYKNISIFRYIDYLVSYKKDIRSNKIVPRIYENGFDEYTKLTRTQLIDRYVSSSEATLKKEYDSLKQAEIQLQETRMSEQICETEKIDVNYYEVLLSKISDILHHVLPEKTSEIKKTMEILRSLEKEVGFVENEKQTAYKEYEKIIKIINYLRRDYNYIANSMDIRQKLMKTINNLDLPVTEVDTIETDYTYLKAYLMNNSDEFTEFRKQLHKLRNKDLLLIENIEFDEDPNLVYITRNNKNKFLICSCLLKILCQIVYDWDELEIVSKPKKISIIDTNVNEDLSPLDVRKNELLAEFVLDFIQNVHKIFSRENLVMENIKEYKQTTFELVSQIERTKRMKFAEELGGDLIREFNKVMKGKRKLDVNTKEVASDNALETAKVIEQDRYDAVPDGQFGKMFENNYQGENEGEANKEELFGDTMDD